MPDLEHSNSAVLNSLPSFSSQRSYDNAIHQFIDWYCSESRLAFNKIVVTLAHNPITEKSPDNDSPFRHTMLSTGQHPSGQFVMDEYAVSYHGLAHTHMDTLCHMAWNGKMYNGFPQTDVFAGRGRRNWRSPITKAGSSRAASCSIFRG